ncbi:hypothetical protein [Tranquillimonas alkanivorans]|uniref:TIGR02594 family protein n=1 Tax=Tranquillimonas alkanivorans TaxID=441119 RepID=A0A1I5MC32_9RHOB|nr:hypothetical protein [Tranquillimonas alkanivorans]SFP06907.1 TIGR02594 family protein [Tranquillimonas alkanivorans]
MRDLLEIREQQAEHSAAGRPLPAGVPWLNEARRLMLDDGRVGLHSGRAALRLLSKVNHRVPLGVPWCGLFVGHCLRAAVPAVDIPTHHARARPWKAWGEDADPQIGAVMVFWHYWQGSPFGHVAFYWAEDEDAFHVLGGNQRDHITIQRYPKDRLVTVRWPEGLARTGRRRYAPPEAAEPFG